MAATLSARFVKRYAGGAVIHGELEQATRGHGITVLFGPSGSGKTTVLRCLAGLERPDEGRIEFDSEVWFDSARDVHLPPQRRRVGLVFQDYALFPHLSVADNVGYGLRRVGAGERRRRVVEMLERLGLREFARRFPHQLSGGQQQRVALARALVHRPRLLLLDEPLSAVDAALREELRVDLRHILAACDMPVLLVTHDRSEALALGDDLVVMIDGRRRQSGTVLEVFHHPADAEVARIVGVETLQPGIIERVEDGLATVRVGPLRMIALAPPGKAREVMVCIRAEDVVLERGTGWTSTSSARNRLTARVVALQPGSPLTRVTLDVGFPLFALVTRPACEQLMLQPGAQVHALIKAPAIHLVPR